MEDKKLFKKVRMISFSYGNYETNLEIPFGFQFDKIVAIENTYSGGSTTSLYAIMLEESSLQEMADTNKAYYDSEVERIKKHYDEQYEAKVKAMNLYQAFSDLVSKFKCGDTAYYYSKYIRGISDEKLIESHIEAIQIDEIVLRKEDIKVKRVNENDHADTLYIKSWAKSPVEAIILYKTKEEAIEANRVYHAKYLQIKDEERTKSAHAAQLRRIEEEAEILRKAEEIKSKTQA